MRVSAPAICSGVRKLTFRVILSMLHDFGRHPARRADERLAARKPASGDCLVELGRRRVCEERGRDAEVGQKDGAVVCEAEVSTCTAGNPELGRTIDEEVRGLHVAVEPAVLMQVRETLERLLQDRRDDRLVEAVLVSVLRDVGKRACSQRVSL